MSKTVSFSFLIIIFTLSAICGKTTFIETTPYAQGEFIVHNSISNCDNFEWFEDTIRFSSGTRITFVNMNQFITLDSLFLGGMVCIDSISHFAYKSNPSLRKTYNWNPPDFFPGEHTFTTQNPDTIWDLASVYPESLATCDTFVHSPDIIKNYDITLFPAKLLYGRYEHYFQTVHFTTTNEIQNYNAIMYVKTENNTHLKLQIEKVKIKSEPVTNIISSTVLQHIKVRWAADSCGNGLFKMYTEIQNTKKNSENLYRSTFMTYINRIPHLNLPKRLHNAGGISLSVFNLQGRKILKRQLKDSNPVPLKLIRSGRYLYSITAGSETLTGSFVISR